MNDTVELTAIQQELDDLLADGILFLKHHPAATDVGFAGRCPTEVAQDEGWSMRELRRLQELVLTFADENFSVYLGMNRGNCQYKLTVRYLG